MSGLSFEAGQEQALLIAELKAENKELKEAAFYLYCNGYEKGHNDTVESCYAPPAEYPEEFPEILTEALEAALQPPKESGDEQGRQDMENKAGESGDLREAQGSDNGIEVVGEPRAVWPE